MTAITASEMGRRSQAIQRARMGEKEYRASRRRMGLLAGAHLSAEERSEHARKAARARWGKPGARKKVGRKAKIAAPGP